MEKHKDMPIPIKETKVQLPVDWKGLGRGCFERSGLFVVVQNSVLDNHIWTQLKVFRKSRYPKFEELMVVKNLFIGQGKQAVIIMRDDLPKWHVLMMHDMTESMWMEHKDGDKDRDLSEKEQ